MPPTTDMMLHRALRRACGRRTSAVVGECEAGAAYRPSSWPRSLPACAVPPVFVRAYTSTSLPVTSPGHNLPPLPTLLLPVDSVPASRPIPLAELGSHSARLFELTFLGTASGRPTLARNVSSLALRIGTSKNKKLFLFDAGDGTQLRLLAARHLSLAHLSLLFVTHMHGDHVSGLPNIVTAACTHLSDEPLHIFGPQGVAQFVKQSLSATHTWLNRPIIFHELLKNNVRAASLTPQADVLYHQNPDYSQLNMQIYEDDDLIIHAGSLKHRELSCWGYVVSEKSASCGPRFRPRKVAILGDTCDSSGLREVARGADVMVHEATFLEAEYPKVYKTGHSTAGMAGAFSKSCDVNHLILTHFSHRYIGSELVTGIVNTEAVMDHIDQAQKTAGHARVYAAQDLQVFHIAPTLASNSNGTLTDATKATATASTTPQTTSRPVQNRATNTGPTPTKTPTVTQSPSEERPPPLRIAMPKARTHATNPTKSR